ncbi:MAG: DUF2089 family protein [Chloroflexota bacterium]
MTRLECSSCGTEVNGSFTLGHLASLREPHASLLEMFLRARGNVKEMERELGLSYPTVRARLEEALGAAGFAREERNPAFGEATWEAELTERMREVEEKLAGLGHMGRRAERERDVSAQRAEILNRLERGELRAEDAAAALRNLKRGR